MFAEMKWAGCPLDFQLFPGSSFNQVYSKSETSLPFAFSTITMREWTAEKKWFLQPWR